MHPENSAQAGSFHIESHAALLQRATLAESPVRPLDAIIVPTIRPHALQPAIDLARDTNSRLVVLCSTKAQARQALASAPRGTTFVTYVPAAMSDGQLSFLTSAHPDIEKETSAHVDIARKRNVGLLLARMCGWRTIMYLDDDIRSLTSAAVISAAAQAGPYRAIGFEVDSYADNSVVCHAHRLAGADQGVFPGGSALLVDVSGSETFFPPVYNEDWFFLFDAVQNSSLAVAGKLTQLAYLPFRNCQRAASEEFGDLLAEGLYRLIHECGDVADATLDYWREALIRRARFIDDITRRLLLQDSDQTVVVSALMSLAAARKRLAGITAVACVSFVRAWRTDLSDWRSRLTGLPVLGEVRDAAKFLDLPVVDAEVAR